MLFSDPAELFCTTQHTIRVPPSRATNDQESLFSVQVTRMAQSVWVWVGPASRTARETWAASTPCPALSSTPAVRPNTSAQETKQPDQNRIEAKEEDDALEAELQAALRAAGRDDPETATPAGTTPYHKTFGTPLPPLAPSVLETPHALGFFSNPDQDAGKLSTPSVTCGALATDWAMGLALSQGGTSMLQMSGGPSLASDMAQRIGTFMLFPFTLSFDSEEPQCV